MDFLSLIFLSMGVSVFIYGMIIVYTRLVPEVLGKLIKHGRANNDDDDKSKKKKKPEDENSLSEILKSFFKTMEVPKSWFGHFYFFAVMFQTRIVFTVFTQYWKGGGKDAPWLYTVLDYAAGSDRIALVDRETTLLVVALFMFHVTRRLLETKFVSVFSGTKMNIFHYIIGFLHYTFAPLSLVSQSVGFCPNAEAETVGETPIMVQVVGVLLFIYGNYEQNKAHRAYANLRKGKGKVEMSHKIPRGGLFELVSCPNYFAEILIYIAFALILGFRIQAWNCCLLWVFSNQIVSGIMNHQWYLKKFGDSYPKTRKAVIPFIW